MDRFTNATPRDNKKSLKDIKIITINVNSIIKNQRRASLMNLIQTQDPDIVLLTETKLSKQHVLRFENYNVVRTDRREGHPGGGTAILIRKFIKYEEVTIPEAKIGKTLEYTVIKINTINNEKLYIIATYARCGYKKEFIPEVNRLFSLLNLHHTGNYYIIAGDLNAKHRNWKNFNNNSRGVVLKNWIEANCMTYKLRLLSTKYPTYPNGNSFLDIVLADTRLIFNDLDEDDNLMCVPYDSDHEAIKFNISLQTGDELELESDTVRNRYNFRKTDWRKFKEILEGIIMEEVPNNRNLTLLEIKDYLQTFNDKILEAIDKIVPRIKEKNSVNVYINDKIYRLQKKKIKFLLKSIMFEESGRELTPTN